MKKRELPPFTSALTKKERIAVLAWLPVHLVLLRELIGLVIHTGRIGAAQGNLVYEAIGFAYLLVFAGHFLRRDFDPLCDAPGKILLEVLAGYGLMLCCNFAVNLLLYFLLPGAAQNPNDQELMTLLEESPGPIIAVAVFLAPVVEELLFRAGVFGCLRQRSRLAAYAVSMLAFALSHVWGYALSDPVYWLYVLPYLPVSFLLCRCYERCNSIWGNIFMHMLVNGISIRAILWLQELSAL